MKKYIYTATADSIQKTEIAHSTKNYWVTADSWKIKVKKTDIDTFEKLKEAKQWHDTLILMRINRLKRELKDALEIQKNKVKVEVM